MNLGVASRFAVLKIEDDDDVPKPKSSNQKQSNAKQNNANAKKKKSANQQKNQNSSAASRKKKKAKEVQSPDQWEQWKSIDEKKVFETYEEDLQEAILQSKIDYERRKKDEPDSGKVNNSKKKKKKESKPTVSLEQFNQMSSHQIDNLKTEGEMENNVSQVVAASASDKQFFKNVAKDTEKIISQEHRKDLVKDRATFLVDSAVSLQIQEEIAKKDARIAELEKKVEQLKGKLASSKERNKMLCNLLAEGESKEKAQILLQNRNLVQVKDELSIQVAELHAALEQEKSKSNRAH